MIEYVDAQKCYMTFCLNAAPISSRVRFLFNNWCEAPGPTGRLVTRSAGLRAENEIELNSLNF